MTDVRLIELLGPADAREACAAAGRAVHDENLRGWAALLPLDSPAVLDGLRQAGVPVLRGSVAALAVGTLSQLWTAARSLADAVTEPGAKHVAALLRDRAGAVEAGPAAWHLPRTSLPRGRTLVMGIVNVTPDSFSDGGRYLDAERAVEHGLRLVDEGADVLDVGGESTNPFVSQPVAADEERRRVEPVIRELARQARVPVSVDTMKASVAQAAIDAGAEIVNDVSGLARDPELGGVVARSGVALCLMHMRGTPQDMKERARYADLHGEVLDELSQALLRATEAGVPAAHVALDPGLGFAKTGAHNLRLLRRQRELLQLGRALVVGASRKSFIGRATDGVAGSGGGPRPASERVMGSVAAAVIAAQNGAAMVRVHDVRATREALAVADAVRCSADPEI